MATCPNTNLKEWKELSSSRGEDMAYFLWDKYNGNVPQSESKQNIVKSNLKAIDALSLLIRPNPTKRTRKYNEAPGASRMTIRLNTKERPNIETNLRKDLNGRGVSDTQVDMIFDYMKSKGIDEISVQDLIIGLTANNSFTVEVNTTREDSKTRFAIQIPSPTQYYSTLTVPGGTEYTENEISTPDITPNIKGHARFSTDQGIGWFRSDVQIKEVKDVSKEGIKDGVGKILLNQNIPTKTRRILEVQSDLFQKSRNKSTLVDAIIYNEVTNATVNKLLDNRFEVGQKFKVNNSWFEVLDIQGDSYTVQNTYNKRQAILTKKALANSINKRNISDSKIPENDFLQLLNQKGNWVNFFIQSIVQDSIKKGYTKVLFPTGETAANIEGHQTLANEIKKVNDSIEETNASIKELKENPVTSNLEENSNLIRQKEIELEIYTEKKDNLKSQGIEKLKPIEAFYTNRVTNILNKLYDVKKITDEYGNTWNEIILDDKIGKNTILLQKKGTEGRTKASPEVIAKTKKVLDKMGVKIQDILEYAKGNPAVDVSGVNALADLAAGIVAVAEGKEDVALTEEMVHIATAIIEQRNPKLITEMISKIGRFKIFKDTLDAYKDLPAYQLENGKPNIRKIKKEAVDKMITSIILGDTSLEEADQSIFRRMWDMITDWFRGQYKKANIDIFSTTAETVIGGEFEGSIVDLDSKEIYYQLTDKQKDFQRKVAETRASLRKIETNEKADPLLLDEEKATSYYELLVNGKYVRITKRVTDRVKVWYRSRFGDKRFTTQEQKDNEVKRVLGTQYHNYFEEAHARFFNEDGTRRETPGPRPNIKGSLNNQVYDKLETYYTDLIASFSENGKNPLVFSELQVYDPKNKEAGTIDLLIVEEDGTANIYDWKFMSVAKGAEDVAWYKQGAYGIQLGTYKKILLDNYGVKQVGKNRAIPIIMDLKRENPQDPKTNLQIKGIEIGSVNPNKIDKLTLTPVSEESETTGVEVLDDVIKQLNAVQAQLSKKLVSSEEERMFKVERLNILNKAIRSLRGNQNIGPLIDAISVMEREGSNIIAEYQTAYEGRPADDKDLTDVQLSDFSANIREYIASSAVFGELTDNIGNLIYTKEMEQDAITEEDKQSLAQRKELLNKLRDQSESIRKSRTKIIKIAGDFSDKFIGERNLVTGLMSPERVVKGLRSLFRGLSDIGLAATDLLYKMANRAMGLAQEESLTEVNELIVLQEKLKARGGNLRDLVSKLYQKDTKGGIVNKLIYKYQKAFYDQVDANAQEGARSKQWLKDNVNLKAYTQEASKILKQRISRINKTYEEGALKEKIILEEQRKWDVNRSDFNGWNNYVIKRHPQEKWQSKEYVDLKKDPELFELYNWISKMNDKATEIGYIDNAVRSTFLPFVRKSMAESIAWDGSLGSISNTFGNLTARADDVGYGSINELTNELENSIPKYYTSDFSKTKEDGTNDYSEVSLDLFKNLILYTNHMNKYKYLTEVEDQLLLAKTVQQFKKNIKTGRFGNAVIKAGRVQLEAGNTQNIKIIDDYFNNALYGKKYAADDTDIALGRGINKAFGREIVNEKDTVISLQKTMDFMNRYTQMKSLGFEFISGAVNIFGGNIQVSAQAGKYFKAREVAKYEAKLLGNKFKNDDERKMFIQLIDKFMPLKDDPTYDKLVKSGMSTLTDKNFSDILFVFFRQPEQHLEKSIFMALLDNMMVEDGKLVNIRDFVKNKYKARYNSAEEYRTLNPKINEEIAELQKTRSINAIKKLEDGKLVVPGLDLNNRQELQRLTNIARSLARTATGGQTEFDNLRINMNVWTRSLMVFKGWIPKLVDTRFGEFRKVADDFNVEIDEDGMTTGERYDIGRVRLWSGLVLESIRDRSLNITNILQGNEQGLKKLDELYEKYTDKYFKNNGVQANLTKEEFADMIQTNLRNQVKELVILLNMLAISFIVGAIAPDDDDDKARKNSLRYFQRVTDKFISELMFFYNPSEMANTLDAGMPLLGLLKDINRFAGHTAKEITGFDISNPGRTADEVRKNAQPTKNLMKMFPLAKSFVNYLAMFDEDFAKEFDVSIPKTVR